MGTENNETSQTPDPKGQVVYRRAGPPAPRGSGREGAETRPYQLAPALTPLIMGFTLLLILVFLLGYFGVRKIEDTSQQVFEMGSQHAGSLKLQLDLRGALNKLNNEARDRDESIMRQEIRPPFDIRLSSARNEVNKWVRLCERATFSQTPGWRTFRTHLDAYLAVTDDQRRYSLEGFGAFKAADGALDAIITETLNEDRQIRQESEDMQRAAARAIRFWTGLALLAGVLIASGTIIEIQRRFRQLRSTMEEARRERAFSNQMLGGMVSAVAAIDARDHIRSANPAFFAIFPGAGIGMSLYEKFASEDAMKMLGSATSSRVEVATYRGRWVDNDADHDGQPRSYDVYSSPLAIDGEQGQIVTLVDVTEAAAAEATVRRNEALAAVGQATAQLAHEIKNPLGSIRLGVAMLRDNVSAPALNTIDLVERGINHLNKLVVDVTEFSRERPLESAETDLQELIESSLELVADRVEDKQTELELNYADAPIAGNWDADQLREVFMNLLANAIDAGDSGAPVTVSTALVAPTESSPAMESNRGARARIVISDRGAGIPEKTLTRIFEPFFTTKKRGTGLGLAISRRIVERHGGTLNVESEVGKGTRFIVDLPLQ